MSTKTLKILGFAAACIPLAWLAIKLLLDLLSADPVAEVMRLLGDAALYCLLASLSVTPIRRLTGLNQAMHLRRMLGLFSAAYAFLHLLVYLLLWHGLDFNEIYFDVLRRPHALVGAAAFVLLLPLIATSTKKMIKRMGARHWKGLHRLVYLIAGLAVIHHYLIARSDYGETVILAIVLAVLLTIRLLPSRYERRKGEKVAPLAWAEKRHIP